jgi:hypothetical protein
MQNSKDIYRIPFVKWIKGEEGGYKYDTIDEFVIDFYKPYLYGDDKEYYNKIKQTLKEKIEDLRKK